MKKFIWALASLCILLATGCSKNDDPDNGGYIKPDQNVADPTGTIELSMRNANNGDTYLDDLHIGKDDNFSGSGTFIASLGAVRGLGNVSSIPSAGWASKVAVTPGCGYVVYNSYKDEYTRIYVVDYITSVTGGIMGADIKYQKPFKGLDEAVRVKQDKVVLPAEGGSQQIVFENNSIIPFKVTSSEPWCQVKKASTRDQNFLYDAIVISCDESYSATESKATVTIETLYGNEKTIEVTRAAKGEFIQLSEVKAFIDYSTSPSSYPINVFTNIEPSDINISSSEDWLSAEFTGASYSPKRTVKWIEKQPATRATLENPVSRELLIKTQGYAGSKSRLGEITISYGNIQNVIKVSQAGSGFTMEETEFKFEAGKQLSRNCNWSGNVQAHTLVAEPVGEDSSWVSVSIYYGYLSISTQINPSTEERTAKIKIGTNASGEFVEMEEITVVQEGLTLTFDQSEITFGADSNLTKKIKCKANFTTNLLSYEWEPSDNDRSWLTSVNISDSELSVSAAANPYENPRYGILKFIYNYHGQTTVAEIKLTQEGATPQDRYLYFESPATTYFLKDFVFMSNAKITSSEDWCVAYPNGTEIVIKLSQTTEDRTAVISVEGRTSKIYISQSKYKVGDTYPVGSINGIIYKMNDGEGMIYHRLITTYAWSTENVNIQGANSYDDGRENMQAIKSIPDWENLYPAFAAVNKLDHGDGPEWYLPAVHEFYREGARYWTSTQASQYNANCWFNSIYSEPKSSKHLVFAINSFQYGIKKRDSKKK